MGIRSISTRFLGVALLFLAAGSVIHAAGHEQEMGEFGGLWRKLPYTAVAFAVAVLSIAGVGMTVGDTMIGFAGYYSKDLIVLHAGAFASLAAVCSRAGAGGRLGVAAGTGSRVRNPRNRLSTSASDAIGSTRHRAGPEGWLQYGFSGLRRL